jgi:hypothetical protein
MEKKNRTTGFLKINLIAIRSSIFWEGRRTLALQRPAFILFRSALHNTSAAAGAVRQVTLTLGSRVLFTVKA